MFKTVKNVAKHSAIYGAGDLLSKILGFLLIPLYTHYLSTEAYGTLELLELTSYIISFMLAMGIGQAVVRFYFEYQEQEKRDCVVSVALITVWVLGVIGFVVLYYLSPFVSRLIFQTDEYAYFFKLVFATLVVNVSNEIPLHYMRILQRSVLYTSISLCRVALNLSLNIALIVYFEMGVEGILVSGLISNAVVGVLLILYIVRAIRLSYSIPLLKRMLAYSIPLIGTWFGGFILHFCDRFLLQRLASLSEVGIYALGYKFGFLINVLLLGPFRQVWNPKQFEIARDDDAPQTFALIFTYLCFLQFLLTLGISALIQDALLVISAENFHSAYQYVPFILVAYNFNAFFSFLQFGLLIRERTKLLAGITLSAGALNIALNYTLIPTLGAWGATYATMGSFFYLFVVTFVIAQRLFYIPFEYLRLSKMIASAAFLFVATGLVVHPNPWISMLLKGAVCCLYPFLLIPLKFYSNDEIGKLREIWRDRTYRSH